MESNGDARITHHEASEALAAADRDESTVRHPRMPAWFFPTMTALTAAFILAQGSDQRSAVTVGIVVVMSGLNLVAYRGAGIAWPSHTFTDAVPLLLVLLATIAAGFWIDEVAGVSWIWVPAAVVGSLAVAITGVWYQRSAGTAA